MLRLLLSVSLIGLVAGGYNLSTCPFPYYGSFYLDLTITFKPSTELEISVDTNNTITVYDSNMADFDFKIETSLNLTSFGLKEPVEMLESMYSSHIPKETPTCALHLYNANLSADIYIIPYGSVAMLFIRNIGEKVTLKSGLSVVKNITGKNFDYVLEGCPTGGPEFPMSLLDPPEEVFGTCEHKYCNISGLVKEVMCPDDCRNNQCMEKGHFTCVLVGNTIIDTKEKAHAVEDFCPQFLMNNSLMTILSYHSERRLSDVPLLDKVHIFHQGYDFQLFQSGVILGQNGTVVPTENGTTVNNIVFTKVPGGVSVTVKLNKSAAEVFFDGTTLHMQYSGYVQDLVGSDTCTSGSVQSLQINNCNTVLNDSRGDGINCGAVTQRCHLLLKEPFSECPMDPEPYITACINLLCNYTGTDGLFCHLLDSYARTCELQDWMDTLGCSPSKCYGKHCQPGKEFCGLSIGGDPKCFCTANYAAPYKAKGTLGDDTVCASKSASVSLLHCLLEEKGINISSLHLNDPKCTGVLDPVLNKVTFSFSDADHCAANVSIKGSNIIYTNTISTPEDDNTSVINREDHLSIKFSCAYTQPKIQTMSLKIMDSSIVKVIDAGEWTYVFNMAAFTDEELKSPVDSGTGLRLDQPLFVKAQVSEVDQQLLAVVIEDCWATEEKNYNATQKYHLKNG
ncbi:uncharacterized protein LOC129409698 [Boleophthalmus pectinirostris]|uniref:uncharacterized protein LOC129409698 n=1 Tax=Boleophthalmus pectinirostris TaxID=150288 RepID=UPI00242C633D|nr:uncharacterized protein LOC129409698 [Boleophthalmus pectinirostris]